MLDSTSWRRIIVAEIAGKQEIPTKQFCPVYIKYEDVTLHLQAGGVDYLHRHWFCGCGDGKPRRFPQDRKRSPSPCQFPSRGRRGNQEEDDTDGNEDSSAEEDQGNRGKNPINRGKKDFDAHDDEEREIISVFVDYRKNDYNKNFKELDRIWFNLKKSGVRQLWKHPLEELFWEIAIEKKFTTVKHVLQKLLTHIDLEWNCVLKNKPLKQHEDLSKWNCDSRIINVEPSSMYNVYCRRKTK